MSETIDAAISEMETRIANLSIRKLDLQAQMEKTDRELAALHMTYATLKNVQKGQQELMQKTKESVKDGSHAD